MSSNSPTKLSLCFILFIFTCMQSETAQLQEAKIMAVYLQDRTRGPNTTVVPIAGIHGKAWTYFSFGTVYCADDPITEGLEESSAQIGRAQGIFVISSLDGSIAQVLLSLVGTNEEYSGSTIEIQGPSRQLEKAREVAVVGGTGKFRYARGYVTFETVVLDLANSYSVVRCNITLEQDLYDVYRPE
uniref:Dirigent protein n=1 Tax=Panax notoginseng TaxID=44586 RepID=A0A411DVA5_9APIA|nr:dirigent family protein [Panax notoginseng]